MREQYGKKKGDEVYYSYLNKNDLDDSKAMPKHLSEADDLGKDVKQNPDDLKKPNDVGQKDGDIAPLEAALGEPNEDEDEHIKDLKYERVTQIQPVQQVLNNPDKSLGGGGIEPNQHDNIEKEVGTKQKEVLNHEDSLQFAYPPPAKGQTLKAAGSRSTIHIPSYKFRYSASPIDGTAGDMLISALVLEPGENINGWEVDGPEFPSVANQYGLGRQLRTNHSAKVQEVFGKSFEGKTLLGKDVAEFLGYAVDGIDPNATYVGARFKATPADQQVRINLEKGYVDTGSIGLDANAFCKQCNLPVTVDAEDGSVSRTCNHLNASVILRNVDVKEYSYVAEPAFAHSKIFPSFAAAVNATLKSSLKHSSAQSAPMSLQAKAKAEGKADADAGNTIDDAKTYTQAEADAYAEARMAIYKKGMADAMKFRANDQKDGDGQDGDGQPDGGRNEADADAEGDAKMEAKAAGGFKDQSQGGPGKGFAPMTASRKTDQVGRTNQGKSDLQAAKNDLISRVLRPTAYAINQDPAMKELFIAAANAPGAPLSVKNVVKEAFRV